MSNSPTHFQHQQQVSLENFMTLMEQQSKDLTITSPRSLQAMQNLSVKQEDLLMLTREQIIQQIPSMEDLQRYEQIIQIKTHHYSKKCQDILEKCLQERQRIINDQNAQDSNQKKRVLQKQQEKEEYIRHQSQVREYLLLSQKEQNERKREQVYISSLYRQHAELQEALLRSEEQQRVIEQKIAVVEANRQHISETLQERNYLMKQLALYNLEQIELDKRSSLDKKLLNDIKREFKVQQKKAEFRKLADEQKRAHEQEFRRKVSQQRESEERERIRKQDEIDKKRQAVEWQIRNSQAMRDGQLQLKKFLRQQRFKSIRTKNENLQEQLAAERDKVHKKHLIIERSLEQRCVEQEKMREQLLAQREARFERNRQSQAENVKQYQLTFIQKQQRMQQAISEAEERKQSSLDRLKARLAFQSQQQQCLAHDKQEILQEQQHKKNEEMLKRLEQESQRVKQLQESRDSLMSMRKSINQNFEIKKKQLLKDFYQLMDNRPVSHNRESSCYVSGACSPLQQQRRYTLSFATPKSLFSKQNNSIHVFRSEDGSVDKMFGSVKKNASYAQQKSNLQRLSHTNDLNQKTSPHCQTSFDYSSEENQEQKDTIQSEKDYNKNLQRRIEVYHLNLNKECEYDTPIDNEDEQQKYQQQQRYKNITQNRKLSRMFVKRRGRQQIVEEDPYKDPEGTFEKSTRAVKKGSSRKTIAVSSEYVTSPLSTRSRMSEQSLRSLEQSVLFEKIKNHAQVIQKRQQQLKEQRRAINNLLEADERHHTLPNLDALTIDLSQLQNDKNNKILRSGDKTHKLNDLNFYKEPI